MEKTIDSTVFSCVNQVISEKCLPAMPCVGTQTLVDDLGLESLDIATIIARLELDLGVEPFIEEFSITDIRTIADLIFAFEKMLAVEQR